MMFRRSALIALSLAGSMLVPVGAQAETRAMTAQDLVTLTRVAAPVSDGQRIVWQQTSTDPVSYKRATALWIGGVGKAPEKLDLGEGSQTDPAFAPDGRLFYLSDKGGSSQLWAVELGKAPRQISHFKTDVAGFKLSPDGKRIALWGEVARSCPTLGCEGKADTAAQGPGSGRHYDASVGFVRHWDSWATPGVYNRAFVFALRGDTLGEGAIALDGPAGAAGSITADTPTRPFGDGADLTWAPDSASVFFVARLSTADEPRSTNLDIWQSKLDGSAPINLTAANKATDTSPVVSPNGRWLAYAAMARPTYEADRLVVMLRDLKTGVTRTLTQDWDRTAASLAWTPDSRALIATADDTLDHAAFRIDAKTGAVARISGAGHVGSAQPVKGGLLLTQDSAMAPAEVWFAPNGAKPRQISHANDAALAALAPITAERFNFKGANGDTVWGISYKPATTEKLPVVLIVHGGPQGSFGDDWSFRWNPRLWASQGYGVVTIDFHGSTGYGQAFTDAIRSNWGGWPLEDLQKGLDAALARDTQLDGSRACAAGASYGGYMMNWIEGAWSQRFKCIIQHDGVFDARAMAYETEELWFDEWEHGGHPYHDAPEAFEKWNPAQHVAKWQTPMLVITSEKDFRIPYTQGIAAFTALQRRGVPAELLVFPDENHWVLKPKNSLQWHANAFAWLNRWLKK